MTTFHINNWLSKYKPQIKFGGKSLDYDPKPKHLGVTLDRQLTYKHHIENTAAKLKTRNNIIHKLAGSSWGAAMSTLALVYSAAEYASPVWLNSSHCSKIDVQLNHSMRIISGTVKSTPTEWLPVLCNILPPHIRRKMAACREWSKYSSNRSLPLHQYTSNQTPRLKSRKPAYLTTTRLNDNQYNGMDEWKLEWQNSAIDKYSLIKSLDTLVPGHQLPVTSG